MARNWITARRMQTGHGINTTGRNGSQNGPLRKVIEMRETNNQSMFVSRQKSLLECGHVIWHSFGSQRARCYKCKNGDPADEQV